jgi:hypothetical protein
MRSTIGVSAETSAHDCPDHPDCAAPQELVLLLSSDQDGEVVGAARAIDRALRSAGYDWHDLAGLVDGAPVSDDNKSPNWRLMREFCLQRAHLLRSREHQFVTGLGNWHGNLTEKQMNWLVATHSRLQRQTS